MRNPQDVDDRLQDFYKHLLGISLPRDVKSLQAFFLSVLRNLVRDWARQDRRRSMREVSSDEEAAEVADERASVEDRVNALQKQEILLEVLASVPPVVRRVFTLRRMYHLPHAEIASKLGIEFSKVEEHLATVGRRFAKAVQRSTRHGRQK